MQWAKRRNNFKLNPNRRKYRFWNNHGHVTTLSMTIPDGIFGGSFFFAVLLLVMFAIHTHQCPDYLTDSVQPYSNNDPARYRLRSATGTNYSTLFPVRYEDEIWRQSFLCGQASRVEQFASGSSSCGQSTLF